MGFLHSLKKGTKKTSHALSKAAKTTGHVLKKTESAIVSGAKTLDKVATTGLKVGEKVLDIADALSPALSIIPGGALVADTVHGLDEAVHAAKDEHHAIKKAANEAHKDVKAVKSVFKGDKNIVSRAHELNQAVERGYAHGGVSQKSRIERHRRRR